ncbi:hypothetical protein DZC73_16540 [Albitalea terrae]|uniref:Toxin VasX N-terminal region domain-containing protein n=1 Tax=Piscinibacter terrae TaxID=2496871 RepID=A0A3N7IYA3_9BURK|nr:hypothetical protein DZC73_16540 [Albitalea terrae]
MTPGVPSWASADRIASVPLGAEFHYALRLLRAGYVYLFYSKNQAGSNKWECYMVTGDGVLYKQPDPLMAVSAPERTARACARQGHSDARLRHLVIERPDKCGKTWIAFSEHKWSADTIKEYTKNAKLRDSRMQTLYPAKMMTGAKHSHGTPASAAALQDVLEYAAVAPDAKLPHDAKITGKFSQEDGGFDAGRINTVSTLYPWALRQGQADADFKAMQQRATRANGSHGTPHVLALWDAIGIVSELNAFRNDAAGWVKLYGEERAFQLDAANNLDGLRKALESRAGGIQKASQDEQLKNASNWNTDEDAKARRKNAEKLPEPQRSRQLEICDILDDWGRRKVPMLGYGARLQHANLANEPERRQEIDKIKAEVEDFLKRRAKNYDANIKHEEREAWPKYEARIDRPALDLFEKNNKSLSTSVNKLIDQRTEAVVAWLGSQLLIDTLEDFHGANISDGVQFEDKVSRAFFAIGSSPAGAKKLKEWVAQTEADKKNLYWRAVALNQDVGIASLNAALKEAEKHRSEQTLSKTVTWVGYTAKVLKGFADTYKKAQSVFDAVEKASSAAGSTAFGATINPIKMRGADRFMIGAGDWAFRHFAFDKLGDYAAEKVIQHIFSIRALVDPLDSERLVQAQAMGEQLSREQTLQRLRTTRNFMKLDTPEIRTAQTEALNQAWAKFKTSGDAKVSQALKDARLALVVGLIEGVNFAKLIADCKMKGDFKSYFSLVASGMSITSALFDVAATITKNLPSKESAGLPGLGSESWTYQSLKGWGGALSGTASLMGGVLDLIDAGKNFGKGYDLLFIMCSVKGLAGIASGAITLAVTFTYAAPLVARLTGRAAAGAAVEAVGERAAALIGLRILGMAAGGWITVGTLVIQVVIWKMTPDALEKWADHTAFGKKRKTGGYVAVKDQEQGLADALKEMGLQ